MNLTLRLGQTVTPFGVGAIYDVLGQSLIACDITYWKASGRRLHAPRLTTKLGLDELRSAPSSVSLFGGAERWDQAVPYARFPKWLFCSQCRGMYRWGPSREQEHQGRAPQCLQRKCRGRRLTPMRFIAACKLGHAMDVPWFEWAHSKAKTPAQKQCASRSRLTFRASGGGTSGLESLWINCHACDSSRSLAGITRPDALADVEGFECEGRQPWQPVGARSDCLLDDEPVIPLVVQRGAGNAYFAHIESALDIPPWSDYGDDDQADIRAVTSHAQWQALRQLAPANPAWEVLVNMIAAGVGLESGTVDEIARAELFGDEAEAEADTAHGTADVRGALLAEEWEAFLQPDRQDQDPRDRFVIRTVALLPQHAAPFPEPHAAVAQLIGRTVIATRLREVKALRGFSRLDTTYRVSPDLRRGGEQTWLPAIEVFGEGIFFTLAEDRLQIWESRRDVTLRAEKLESRRAISFQGQTFLKSAATPRLILVHTLAHVLLRQLAFECGYASASLRERLYVSERESGPPRAGVLIYTAAGDSEGSLGGLARQGEPPRLVETLVAALTEAAWCSTDPVCLESEGQGVAAMNLAACHACALVAETSCTHFNSLLDRELLVGALGYFAAVPQAGLEAAVM